jgi:hypothetical protein
MDINWTSIVIIINNYFHDLATALLLTSAVILWVLGKQAEKWGPAERLALAKAYPTLVKFAKGAFVWIILGGIPRTIFFTRYEWDPATVHGIIPALMVKHVFMVTAIVIGALMWRRMAKLAKAEVAASEVQAPSADVAVGGAG